MQVKLLDYGVPSEMQPKRAHANDVGADVYALKDRIIEVGCSAVIGLGFGLDLPAGFGAFTAMSLFRMSSLLRRRSIRFRPALTAWTFLTRSQK